MRNISFAMTTAQLLDGTKDVTRRIGWRNLKPGQRLRAVKKAMGLKKGEKMEPLAIIEVVSTRREPLDALLGDVAGYGFNELRREGFGHDEQLSHPVRWVPYYCQGHGCKPSDEVTRIKFRVVEVLAREEVSDPAATRVGATG